jgi:hypothetical protein
MKKVITSEIIMNLKSYKKCIKKYGIQLKPVEESDADFIIELRTNNQKI